MFLRGYSKFPIQKQLLYIANSNTHLSNFVKGGLNDISLMDNVKGKNLFLFWEIGYGEETHPSHPTDCSADRFFPLKGEALNLNYLII